MTQSKTYKILRIFLKKNKRRKVSGIRLQLKEYVNWELPKVVTNVCTKLLKIEASAVNLNR